MPWKYEFTSNFANQIGRLTQPYQKIQIKRLFETVRALKNPTDRGAPYMQGWSYIFGSKGIIQCDIDPEKQIVYFTNLIP